MKRALVETPANVPDMPDVPEPRDVPDMRYLRDPVAVTPKVVKVKLETDRVRVLEFLSHPGDKEDWHSHPPFVTYVLSGGTLRITTPDGKSADLEFKTGDTLDRPPGAHITENVGKTPLHAILFELKTP